MTKDLQWLNEIFHKYELFSLGDKSGTDKKNEAKAAIAAKLEQVELETRQQGSSMFRDLMLERLSLKFTQADMAIIIGVSRLTYIKWEKNMSLMPIGRYKQICIELDRLTELKAQLTEKGDGDE